MVKLKNYLISKTQTGQGLVEFALVLPILLLMLIGLFEMGYAIRGQMILRNINREATRLAVRPVSEDEKFAGGLDLEQTTIAEIGYQKVITHAFGKPGTMGEGVSDQLDSIVINDELRTKKLDLYGLYDEDPNATVIISHIAVDTGKVCQDDPNLPGGNPTCYDNCPGDVTQTHPNVYTKDDLILHADLTGYEHLQFKIGNPDIHVSRIDLASLAQEMAIQNDYQNCLKRKSNPNIELRGLSNGVVVIEMFYDQSQLLGLFRVGDFTFLDPVPLYTKTIMRIDTKPEGLCEVYPIPVSNGTMNGWNPGDSSKNIWTGLNKRWLRWNSSGGNLAYLVEMLNEPRLATNDYSGGTLGVGSTVSTFAPSGWNGQDVKDALNELIFTRKHIRVPVGAGSFNINSFAIVEIVSYDLNNGIITAKLITKVDSRACPN